MAELELVRGIVAEFASLGITEISRTVCELLEWKRPNGGLKNLECRQMLDRLCDQGLLSLPALRRTKPRGPQAVRQTARSDPGTEMSGSAGQYEPLRLQLLEGEGAGDSALFREYLDRYHYQRYRVPFGAHLRYLVRSERYPEHVLACLLWAATPGARRSRCTMRSRIRRASRRSSTCRVSASAASGTRRTTPKPMLG